MPAAIELREVTEDCGAVRALDRVSLIGEVIGFLGPNRAGKTTSIRILFDQYLGAMRCNSTRMTLQSRGEPSGLAKLADRLLPAMRRANRKDLTRLKSLLEDATRS